MKINKVWFSGLLLIALGAYGGFNATHQNVNKKTSAPLQERVMVIGGSVAHGWKDVKGEGYLHRAFQLLQANTKVKYEYFDRTIVGANGHQLATMYRGDYSKWLKSVHPTIVVISWGLLNDALPKTSYPMFRKYLKQEIQVALQYHAVVLVVSPPITKATYTQYPIQETKYDQTEANLVKSMHNPNVYFFDVLSQMKDYLIAHHQTYKPYEGDGWHPNTRGHILAGQLLEADIKKQFGDQPIKLHTKG